MNLCAQASRISARNSVGFAFGGWRLDNAQLSKQELLIRKAMTNRVHRVMVRALRRWCSIAATRSHPTFQGHRLALAEFNDFEARQHRMQPEPRPMIARDKQRRKLLARGEEAKSNRALRDTLDKQFDQVATAVA